MVSLGLHKNNLSLICNMTEIKELMRVSDPSTIRELPRPIIRNSDSFKPQMSFLNLFVPTCTCLTPLNRVSLITEFCKLRQKNVLRKDALHEIGLRADHCKNHFKTSLLRHAPIYKEDGNKF